MEKDLLYILTYKMYKGECTLEEQELINAWVSSSESNKVIFQNLIQTLEVSNMQFDTWQADVNKGLEVVMNEISHKKLGFHKRIITWRNVAALFILLLGISSILLNISNVSVFPQKIEYVETVVGFGDKARILLPDGSTVWLNSNSTLKYPVDFNKKRREVELTGEAHFQVAKSKSAKFEVSTSNLKIVVLGTNFHVSAFPNDNEISIYLFEGKISIEDKLNKNLGVLNPKDQAIYSKTDSKLIINRKLERVPSVWQAGELIIRGQSLVEFTEILKNRIDVDFVFEDNECKKYIYSGTIGNESISEIMQALSMASPITYKIEGKKISIKSKEQIKK